MYKMLALRKSFCDCSGEGCTDCTCENCNTDLLVGEEALCIKCMEKELAEDEESDY